MASAINNRGIHAMKMRKVKGDTGHEAHNKIPDRILKTRCGNFFKWIVFEGGRSEEIPKKQGSGNQEIVISSNRVNYVAYCI
jgi:hypothetical protein